MACPAILASGPRKGQKCGRPIRDGDTVCGRHSKNSPIRLQKTAAQDQFLAAFAEIGVLTAAAERIGISRLCHYDWLKEPGYAARFQEANEMAADVVEAEMWRRGVLGFEEPVVWQGQLATQTVMVDGEEVTVPLTIRKYSDACLFGMAKSRRPEKFRERYEVKGQIDVQHTVAWQGAEGEILGAAEQRLAIDAESTEADA